MDIGPALTIGLCFSFCIGLGVGGGFLFDNYFQTKMLGVGSGLIFGIIAGCQQTLKIIREAEKRFKENRGKYAGKNR
ncbi:MAG: AtpZ/AtpI family protein [Candidatus Riflebacteria bacterium]|nr:AtpZ/AtpI family protein [Candidatus Riflebacteria bacterium]